MQLAESKLAKHLADHGASVRCAGLPDGPVGDDAKPTKLGLDDFLVLHGPGPLRKLLDTAIEPVALQGPEGKARADTLEPAETSQAFLAERQVDGATRLRFWRGSFYFWTSGRYVELEPSEVNAELVRWINHEYAFLTTGVVGNVLMQVKAQSALSSHLESPCWLEKPPVPWPASEVLAMRRELIHIPSLMAGSEPFSIAATPRYFTLSALAYDLERSSPVPKLWLEFMEQLFGDDEQGARTLQEFFGYYLTPDTSQQKILMLIGPRRGGKGVISRTLTGLVGHANVCGPTLASLATQFGLQTLISRRLAIIADARLSGKSDQAEIIEPLLSISGEDMRTVDRKYRDHWHGKIPARLMLVSNELPQFTEASGALAGRMIIVRLTKTFWGQEDSGLSNKLRAELPGILLWALEGWRRLRERGHFVQPESGKELASDLADLASPVALFLRECCVISPKLTRVRG